MHNKKLDRKETLPSPPLHFNITPPFRQQASVIVHAAWQRRSIGLALVSEAITRIQARSITIIHVDFVPEHQAFYERCGFQTGLGGIIGA